jgi:hypothetical protein
MHNKTSPANTITVRIVRGGERSAARTATTSDAIASVTTFIVVEIFVVASSKLRSVSGLAAVPSSLVHRQRPGKGSQSTRIRVHRG